MRFRSTRVVLDSTARLPLDSQLVRTSPDVPLLLACAETADPSRVAALVEAGVEVIAGPVDDRGRLEIANLLEEFGTRRWTNVLVEGGSEVLGALADGGWIDEAHVFLAPKLVGGREALGAVGGDGLTRSPEAASQMGRAACREGGEVSGVAGA